MADFTILRFSDCNRTLLAGISRHKQWLFLWFAAVLLLFWNLGTGAFAAFECGPAAAVQDYMMNPDIQPLKDRFLCKLIWLFSSPVRMVNELTARMPAAMAALLVLGAVIVIAQKLAGRQAAIASGWFCLTTVGFLTYGRMVTDEMTICALILWASAIYLYSREKITLCSSILFWLITAFGVYTGGLFALFPVLIMFLDAALNSRVRSLFHWRNLVGAAAAILYFYLLYTYCDFRCADPGISLHVDFTSTAVSALPWLPLIVLSFFDIGKRRRQTADFRLLFYWFLLTTLSTFFFKNAVLPLLGISVVLCGVMMTSGNLTVPQLISKLLFRLVDALMPLAALTLLVTPFLFMWLGPRYQANGFAYPNWFVAVFYFLAPFTGVLIFIWQSVMLRRKRQKKSLPELCGAADPVPDRVIPITAFVLLLLFAVIFPSIRSEAAFYSRKPFLLQAKELLLKQYSMKAPQRIYLLQGNGLAECKVYLRSGGVLLLPVLEFEDRKALDTLKEKGGVLIGTRRDFALRRIPLDGIVLSEPLTFSDHKDHVSDDDKLAALLFLK